MGREKAKEANMIRELLLLSLACCLLEGVPMPSEPSEHLANDGTHLWGLEDFHVEEEGDSRQKRSPEEAEEDPNACEEGSPHCFHGQHLFNLGPYHIEE